MSKRIALYVMGSLLAAILPAAPASASMTWALANPSQIAAYQIGKGVITIASISVLGCETDGFVATGKPFVYNFEVGTPKGMLCLSQYWAPIAAYYQAGSPSTVTVNTKAGPRTINVTLPPPQSPAIGHLPFH
jgi:hypothetical protein